MFPLETFEISPSGDRSLDALSPSVFDANVVKREFPILSEPVRGKRLVWLDNAATTQKPQAVDRPPLVLLRARELQRSPRRPHAGGARDRRLRGRAREASGASSRRPRRARSSSCAGTTEGDQPGRAELGAPQRRRAGDEVVITWLEHHANIVPWQQLCAEKGARLRVAPVDDRGQVILEEYEKLLGPQDAHRLVHAGLQRARHDRPGARR